MPETNVEILIKKFDEYMEKHSIDGYMKKLELIALELRNPELSYWFITSTSTTNRDNHLEIIYSSKNWSVMLKLIDEYSRFYKNVVDYKRISDEFLASANLWNNYLLYKLLHENKKDELANRHQKFIETQMSEEMNETFTFVYPFMDYPTVEERNEWYKKVDQIEMIQLTRNISSEQNK